MYQQLKNLVKQQLLCEECNMVEDENDLLYVGSIPGFTWCSCRVGEVKLTAWFLGVFPSSSTCLAWPIL